jgi:predicted ABC-type sugar transport system permease subunit
MAAREHGLKVDGLFEDIYGISDLRRRLEGIPTAPRAHAVIAAGNGSVIEADDEFETVITSG